MVDVLVIGAGPSGLMASIAAAERGARTTLLDKGDKPGRKLAISGGGRCNVTNAKELDELIRNIPGNGRFLYSALSTFGNREIIAFFEGLGIPLKEEDNGRMFPVTDRAKTVVEALVGKARSLGVDIRLKAPVRRVVYEGGRATGAELMSGEILKAKTVIVATGGCSVPKTGSTGDGYAWAREAGHTITELYPTEVPLTSREPFIANRELQGLSLRRIALSVWNDKGKRLVEHRGDMIFTHFGLSGPAALRCSQFVVKELKRTKGTNVVLTLDLFPDLTEQDVRGELERLKTAEPRKRWRNVLKTVVPERLVPVLLSKTEADGDLEATHIPKAHLAELARLMKAVPIHVNGTLSLEEAFVTGGGVHLKEIDPKTMGSKLMPGLYFCGEILDVHGYTGGYNITAAFSTGYTAGLSAAETALGQTGL